MVSNTLHHKHLSQLLPSDSWVDENNLFHVPVVSQFQDLPPLPHGYAFKGGSARILLNLALGRPMERLPRDIDIVRLDEIEPNSALDENISERFMPDDFKHGHGVEVIYDQKEYFNQHDFTLNELYSTSEEIVLSEACLKDTLNGVVRLTDYEYDKDYTSCKLFAKALRFVAESNFSRHPLKIDNKLENCIDSYGINAFHIALHLDRAWGQGEEIAQEYISLLQFHNQLPPYVSTPRDAVEFLSDYVYDFEYKNAMSEHHDYDPMDNLEKYAAIAEKVQEASEKQKASDHKKLRRIPKEKFTDEISPKYHRLKRTEERSMSWLERVHEEKESNHLFPPPK